MQKTKIYPVIMCGGSGTRLWPLSTNEKPKQYHTLTSDQTMLQETISRMVNTGEHEVAAPSFICSVDHQTMIFEQTRQMGLEPLRVILEPTGRNTAPVAAISADIIGEIDQNGIILLLPADHNIADISEFWRCVGHGVDTALKGNLVTLGLQPSSPETGYGYIRKGAHQSNSLFAVDRFVEKPNLETAKSYVDSGEYFWNAGIFMFTPAAMIKSFKTHAPQILQACRDTLAASKQDQASIFLDPLSFSKCPADSIDYAIMEHAGNIMLIAPVDVGWNDIGSWNALDVFEKTRNNTPNVSQNGNVEIGETVLVDCHNNYIRSDGLTIAAIGLNDLIIVATDTSVLILPKNRGQEVKRIVEDVKRNPVYRS